jgi:hypothetical protein
LGLLLLVVYWAQRRGCILHLLLFQDVPFSFLFFFTGNNFLRNRIYQAWACGTNWFWILESLHARLRSLLSSQHECNTLWCESMNFLFGGLGEMLHFSLLSADNIRWLKLCYFNFTMVLNYVVELNSDEFSLTYLMLIEIHVA